jgi:hypothetical protein
MKMTVGYGVLSGAIMMGYFVAGLLFLRFFRSTRDRLFAIFAGSFFLLGVQRLLLTFTTRAVEDQVLFYVLRLIAFLLILAAVIDKNRRKA